MFEPPLKNIEDGLRRETRYVRRLGSVLRCLFLAVSLFSSAAVAAELLPIEDFCRASTLTRVRLSPDGKHMAAITSEKGQHYILVSDLVTGKITRFVMPPLRGFEWLTSERLLCHAGGFLFGEEFAVNIDGTQLRVLLDSYFTQAMISRVRIRVVQLLKVVPGWPDSVLVEDAYATRDSSRMYPHPEVNRLNFFTGKMTREEKNPGNVVRWLADNDGNVRGAVALDKHTVQLLYRRSKQERWAVAHTSTRDDSDLFPIRFGGDGQLYVYSHNGGEALGLYRFDLEGKRLGACLSREDPSEPVSSVFSPGGDLLGVFYETDRVKFKPLNEEYSKIQARLDAALPETINVPVSTTRDGGKILYLSYSDRDPGAYHLVDTAKNEFGAIGRSAPWIKPERMAAVQPIQYAARDGLTIHGYLTLPPGAAATNLPLVVMPHGGPAARDSWHYDPEVQFLASRGYAVLQMNFRGSTGYGLKFLRAGFKEWGGKMQDDITDGVRWAIARGIADQRRVAMFGASYGGYAALMGLISTPELFKCAICYAGVTDVGEITRNRDLSGEFLEDYERVTREQIGDYRSEKTHLREISPVYLAGKIQAPILLAYGAEDPIVPIEQGRALAKALKKNKKQFELIVEENEGHCFSSKSARSNLLYRVEVFLRACLENR